ncbi:2-amino-4-hydroxy-6-hydroxymethyldihydropteridine diphosphokinase [Alishewanella sp. 16-MA]|uniref:2-amino-4-hydroxy-6-hydroxymethyldihydropteridine diphosphokinase n=1 Tax=Alishewanella maricola TaxID=2795740 RepID=A0ABS8C5P0_9ALTE|nr:MULTISPECIES: 2-amino-4-hydroxy-6-hydroxymethyldihydropteridine diphosphokinase [Gammaproteobacteria]MDP4944292.1 2-amino-4-hydroxy-6-hydroxymethyldihydropteridine diphosphokinase [Alishewanella sp.]MDP5205918.1 2-amino-4-hydroxy-6-hydroxymethyldihydropteridine diphosphokinase [Alishewanella sp. SMS9]MCB5227661.1 2-amino-4-hydroxy-6-hydroxymethyldihydropteridine diphosphokinase [Alishewanella maricola]MCC5452681.1 2-amino-4-hydroxy-6-hydroxymethyldihydropteridine diphosphokinase [Rheinheimer
MPRIYISVGSNINRDFHVRHGVRALVSELSAVTLSSVYQSEAVGFVGDDFFNMVLGADTDLSIVDCISLLKRIEDQFGRVRGAEKFSGRTLDLDLLTYDQQICDSPVVLPRAEITENAFVLWPLAEIAADEIHPTTGLSYAALWQGYNQSQKIWPVEFSWSEPT